MSALVVDASVAAKWFLIEAESAKAAAILAGQHDLFGPTLLRLEVAAAIVRRLRNGGIDEVDARRKLEHAQRFLVAPGFHLDADDGLLPRAVEMSILLQHPLQDCLYIACAERNGAELVSVDATLLKRASPHFGFVRAL